MGGGGGNGGSDDWSLSIILAAIISDIRLGRGKIGRNGRLQGTNVNVINCKADKKLQELN